MRRKRTYGIMALMLLLTMLWPAAARADILTEGIPQIDAASYIVIEGSTGEILFGRNYTEQADPASITKIMTGVLAVEKGDMERIVTVGEIPQNVNGTTTLMLRKGEKLELGMLLKGALIFSANDAAWAIADAIGGEEKFIEAMNEKAKELGMKSTTFKNPHGLSEEGHMTTAEDMAILGRYAMSLPTFREIVGMKSFVWTGEAHNGTTFSNKNTLFEIMPEATGIKSGFTTDAKNTLVGSAMKDGRELIGVILGSSSKTAVTQDMKTILDYGFNNTKIVPVVQKDAAMTNVSFGEKKQVRVVAGETYSVVRSADNNAIVETAMTLNDINLPIKAGQQVGVLDVRIDGASVKQVPLVSLDDAKGSINWLLLFTCLMTVLYILQMILRMYRMAMRSYQKSQQSAARTAPARDNGANPPRPSAARRKTLEGRSKDDPTLRQ